MTSIDGILQKIDANQPAALQRLLELLKIPSISTDPTYDVQCAQAADWLVKELTTIGFEAKMCPTKGKPFVLAHAKAKRSDAPHILFYGHFDVQPPDPLELWHTMPFEPTVIDEAIYARGASDDKGQLMTFIEACRAFYETGGLPCEVTIILEGEEESGSPTLDQFITENRDALSADLMLVCDTGLWEQNKPAIITSLRGNVQEEVIIRGAKCDLHSGLYGGLAANPANIMAKVIAGLHDEQGKITLPDFYDGVEEPPNETLDRWRALGFDVDKYLGEVGLQTPAGEESYSPLELLWARPTCDVNGMSSGYTGIGTKTIIPANASAKFSFRIVGKQDPKAIVQSFRTYVKAALPQDCSVEFISHGASPAVHVAFNNEILSRTERALNAEWGTPPALIGSGASIPVVGTFKETLKIDALLIGFALSDDQIHSPNEKYSLSSFHKGARSWARILVNMAAI